MTGVTTQPDRDATLDVLRGVAILGIFPVNLLAFGWPEVMLYNPLALMAPEGPEWALWVVTHVLFEQKFYTLLSLVFGASLLLFEHACKQRTQDPNRRHTRRMLVLGLLGLMHAYGLWFGDILYVYALCGMLAWWMRQRSTPILLWSGAGLMLVPVGLLLALQALVYPLTDDASLRAEMQAILWPPEAALDAEIMAYQGTWWTQMPLRARAAADAQFAGFLGFSLWKTWGLMLWGMALWRLGFGTLQTALTRRWRAVAIWGLLPLGLAITATGLAHNLSAGFSASTALFGGQVWNYVGSLMTALGYAALLIGWCLRGRYLTNLAVRLQAVGRVALTAYLSQTLIATTLFYGHGWGQFGTWRLEQGWLLVVAVWGVLLLWAPWQMRCFGSGPMEALWRRLSAQPPIRTRG